MKNINIEVKKDTLIITVNLKETFGPSKSGKTIVVASTEGNKEIAQGVYLGLNAYRYPDKG